MSSSTESTFFRLTVTKISTIKAFVSTDLTSVSAEPSAPHAEASQSVLDFSVTVINNTFKQTMNSPIKNLGEEELKVKHQNSIMSLVPSQVPLDM